MGGSGDDIEDLALEPHGTTGYDEEDKQGADDADGATLAVRSSRRRRRLTVVAAAAASKDEEDDLDAAADEAVGVVPGTARVWVKTMGCAHNVADSETMAGVLQEQGYRVEMEGQKKGGGGATADAKQAADVWILNSCTVKDPSEQAVSTFLREAHAAGKAAVVAGCVPQGQRSSKVLLPPAAPPLPATSSSSSSNDNNNSNNDARRRRRPLAVGLLGVAQLGRVAEVVEAAVRGESLALLGRGRGEGALPSAELPQARRNPHVAIVPLSQGCLGSCTYCKTVHARGALSSYAPEQIEARVLAAARDPLVREVHLSSEDVGAYGRDRGTTLAALLGRLTRALDAAAEEHGQVEEVEEEFEEEEGGEPPPPPPPLPQQQQQQQQKQQQQPKQKRRRRLHRVLLRVGMSNPPFLLRDGALDAVSACLRHPAAFRWLHLPVQSGDDGVLRRMNREYTRADFEACVSGLKARVPGLVVATDVIVGFPGEDDAAFEATLDLLRQHRFPSAHVTRFYPRPGTPAARYRPRVPTQVQKARSSAAALVVEGRDLAPPPSSSSGPPSSPAPLPPYSPYRDMVGSTQRVVVVDVAADGVSLVAHARNYAQVLLSPAPGLMGAVADARIVSASRWSVRGEVVRVLFSPPLLKGGEAGDEAEEEGALSSAAAAARARVRAAREQRAAAAAKAATAKADSGKDEGESAAPHEHQRLAAVATESSAPQLPPTPPQRKQGEEQQQQQQQEQSPSPPPRSSSSTVTPKSPPQPSEEAAGGAPPAPAAAAAAAASSPDVLASALLSAGLLLLAAAMLVLGATTLRDLGRLA